MSTFTKGPWFVQPYDNGCEFDICQGDPADPWFIAATADMEGQSEANARLISAAPDMYEALKELLNEVSTYGSCTSASSKERAKAALSKADGREG